MIDSLLTRAIATDLGHDRLDRASYVLPCNHLLRTLFQMVRRYGSDDSLLAAWTRTWGCDWYIDATPAGGEVLAGRWANRADAITAEIEYLNRLFIRQ